MFSDKLFHNIIILEGHFILKTPIAQITRSTNVALGKSMSGIGTTSPCAPPRGPLSEPTVLGADICLAGGLSFEGWDFGISQISGLQYVHNSPEL